MPRRWVLPGLVAIGLLVLLPIAMQACRHWPPSDIDDVCAIFEERPSWRGAAEHAAERWAVPVSVQMAILHQESRFRANARPDWKFFLWVIPVGRQSSAFGYGQVKDGTWQDYLKQTDRKRPRRDRFADAADFVGWYGDVIHRSASVPKGDAYGIYLAYHEGPGGYRRGTWKDKPWLLGVARKVEKRAARYAVQLHHACPSGR